MSKNNNSKIIYSGFGIIMTIFVAFAVLAFLLINDKGINFWIGFCFFAVAIMLDSLLLYMIITTINGYYFYPSGIIISLIHTIIQFVFSIFVMSVSIIEPKMAFSIQFIILIVYIVLLILLFINKNKIQGDTNYEKM